MMASPVSDVTPTRFSPCHNSAPATGAPTSSTTDTVTGVAPLAKLHPAQAAQTSESATSSRKNSCGTTSLRVQGRESLPIGSVRRATGRVSPRSGSDRPTDPIPVERLTTKPRTKPPIAA